MSVSCSDNNVICIQKLQMPNLIHISQWGCILHDFTIMLPDVAMVNSKYISSVP